MDKLGVEEVAINLELMKRSRFYHILNPNGTKIFNCNAYRLFLFLYGSIVNCIVVFSTLGFFVEMDDTLSFTDLFVAIFVLINFFLCYWRICVFMYNVNAIHEVLSVSRFDLLKSKHCCKHVNVLNDYRDRTIKITNYFFLFSSTVMSQWFIYPLVVIAFTRPEDENGRFQNIMNLRYPVSTYTYNHYYFIFYLMEVVVAIFTMYAMIIPDILLMCVCWAIIAQQKVLTRAFKNIGHEDNSQMVYYEDFKLILLDQLQLNLFSPFFVEPMIVALDEVTLEPYMCDMDLIDCVNESDNFVVGGTSSSQLYGLCEAFWEPDMEEDQLFETISQALVSACNRDAISGWGAK
ncbi:uncharacterized protein LOC132948166 isoform X3 [Metopolophium dirhodum]|nr:uncharacterized protein LOC132948166 isoform X3 [Metopolophium dirhodum]